jgi:hypothetical protein
VDMAMGPLLVLPEMVAAGRKFVRRADVTSGRWREARPARHQGAESAAPVAA